MTVSCAHGEVDWLLGDLVNRDVDAGLIAYEMAVLVKRSGERLGAAARPAPASSPG
jgi:hypothetical protein